MRKSLSQLLGCCGNTRRVFVHSSVPWYDRPTIHGSKLYDALLSEVAPLAKRLGLIVEPYTNKCGTDYWRFRADTSDYG